MKIFLVIAAAAVVLLVASCDVEFRWWTATGDSNIPAAQEVNKVIDAAYRDSLDETLSSLYLTINRADKGTRQGAFIIDHEVPGLAARIDELIPAARQRVAAVRLETPAGAGHWEVSWPSGPLQATVKVTPVSAGNEDAVREALNDLIKHANENAERDRRAASEQAETDQQTAARTAQEMTERFRSGT